MHRTHQIFTLTYLGKVLRKRLTDAERVLRNLPAHPEKESLSFDNT